ncbi:DUF4147 domain-containing protein [bacterium]|nr:DUF4147 domain-containing protein [bacterium]
MQVLPFPPFLNTNYVLRTIHVAEQIFRNIQPDSLFKDRIFIKDTHLHINSIDGKKEIIRFENYTKIFMLGAGKSSAHFARAIIPLIPPEKLHTGLILTKYGFSVPCEPLPCLEGAHPIPNESNVENTLKLISLALKAQKTDLVIFLLSGGASALLCAPQEGISLKYIQTLTRELIAGGASITEMNTVRSFISQVKGGGLLKLISPAECITLTMSDVIGDSRSIIGSGPTYCTFPDLQQCTNIINKYNLKALKRLVNESTIRKLYKNHQIANKYCTVTNVNDSALKCRQIVHPEKMIIITKRPFQGDIVDYSLIWLDSINKALRDGFRGYLIGLSECSVNLNQDHGKGGRNQHLALLIAKYLGKLNRNISFISMATDGDDGYTINAGAIINEFTWNKSTSSQKYLDLFDSNSFFTKIGGLITTGPTGTNINDFQLLYIP